MENRHTFITIVVILILIALGIWWLSGRNAATIGGDSPTTSEKLVTDQALVRDASVQVLQSLPLQVNVMVRGDLPDPCTTIGTIDQALTDRTFTITVNTARPAAATCAQVITPFTETIPLRVSGLSAGTYTVLVNGVREVFTLTANTGTSTPTNSGAPLNFGDKL